MRCSFCLGVNLPAASRCVVCSATLDEPRHREYAGIVYLLGQLGKWEECGRLPGEAIAALRTDYAGRRDGLKEALRPPARPPVVIVPPQEPPALPPPAPKPIVPPPPRPEPRPLPAAVVRPVRPPFSWKELLTERNIRWILNLGILIFSVALVVFIHTRWEGMSPGLKVGFLFSASFGAMAGGHFLRRTMLKATGMALVLLGAIAVPIDGAAVVQFKLVDPAYGDGVGLGGAILSLLLYLGLSRLYPEKLFSSLATLASAGAWVFSWRLLGQEWAQALALVAPFGFVAAQVKSAHVRVAGWAMLAGSLILTGGLLAVRSLRWETDFVALETALASGLAGAVLLERRSGKAAWGWAFLSFAAAMFFGFLARHGIAFESSWGALALFGAALGLGWPRGHAPSRVGSVGAFALGLVACLGEFPPLAFVLATAGAVHAGQGMLKKQEAHAFAGWLLLGGALAAVLNATPGLRLWQPLAYAGYGVGMAALSRRLFPRSFHILSVVGAGAAMFLLALWYMEYYKPPDALASRRWLGAAIALVSALGFGPVANALRSRFVSDITYGCLGFAYILTLRALGVPPAWLGLSITFFGIAYVLLEKRISRWLLRPTLFTGIACTIAAGTFAGLQIHEGISGPTPFPLLPASLSLLLIGGFYLAVARFTPYKGLAHVGVYVASVGLWVALHFAGLRPEARPLFMFLPAGAGLIFAARGRDLHLGLASLVVSLGALAWSFLNPDMYFGPHLLFAVALSVAAGGVAGLLAFQRGGVPGVDAGLMSGLMAGFASAAYILFLRYLSKGSPWGGLVVFAFSVLLGVAAELLRRRGFARQALPIAGVSLAVTAAALFAAHGRGADAGIHLAVYALAAALYTLLGRALGRAELSWAGSFAGMAGLLFWLLHWSPASLVPGLSGLGGRSFEWIGLCTFPVSGLLFLKRYRPLWFLGAFAAVVGSLHVASASAGRAGACLLFLPMSAFLVLARVPGLSLWTMALGGLVAARENDPWQTAFLFAGFSGYLALSLTRREPFYIYSALVFALAGDFSLALQIPGAEGLSAFPLALVLFAMGHEIHRRFGAPFAWPLLGASAAAAALATLLGFGEPVHRVWLLLGDGLLAGAVALTFRKPFAAYASAACFLGFEGALMAWADFFPAFKALPVAFLLLGAGYGVFRRWGKEFALPYAGASFAAALLAVGVSLGDPTERVFVTLGQAFLFLLAGILFKKPALLYAAALSFVGFHGTLLLERYPHAGLATFQLALLLFGMAYALMRRLGKGYGWPVVLASFGSALLSTVTVVGDSTDRIFVFLGDAVLFALAAVVFRRPELVYPCSAALVALDLALMVRFQLSPTQAACQLLSLSVVKILFVRAFGNKAQRYLEPVFVGSLVIAAGVLAFGLYHYEAYTTKDINTAIAGFVLMAVVFGLAGRLRKVPAFLYAAAAQLLAAYYLALQKFDIEALEFYTVPIGAGVAAWSLRVPRSPKARPAVEGLAAALFFVPSAVLSYLPDGQGHTLAALVLAFGLVLGGMVFRRRVFLFGGTGLFVAEVFGKALQFLVRQDLSLAEWGMILGGLIILLAAAFESRKARGVRDKVDLFRAGAHRYFARWE